MLSLHDEEPTNTCMRGGRFKAYKNWNHGILSYFTFLKTEFYEIISLENVNGVYTMNDGHGRDVYHELHLTSSTLVGEVKLSALCPTGLNDCPMVCSDLREEQRTGLLLTTTTDEGKEFPLEYHEDKWDYIYSHSFLYVDAFITDTTFRNFIPRWESACLLRESAIKTNPYLHDHYPIHYFTNTRFENVDRDSIVYIEDNDPEDETRCGEFPCSGRSNVLLKFENTVFDYEDDVQDYLVPNKMNAQYPSFQIISDNEHVSKYMEDCEEQEAWNAWFCFNENLALLEIEALPGDYEEAVFPAYFIRLDGMRNEANSYLNFLLDYHAIGMNIDRATPVIKPKYPGIIETGHEYEVEFYGSVPYDMKMRINGVTSSSKYAYVTIKYDRTLSVVVRVNEEKIPPIVNYVDTFHGTNCGDNEWDPSTHTMNLYLTPECWPDIHTIDSIQFTIRLSMTVDEFLNSNGSAQMIDKLAAALGIHTSRIRVVGIRSGSTVCYGAVDEDDELVDEEGNASTESQADLTSIYQTMGEMLANNEIEFFEGVVVEDFDVSIQIEEEVQAEENELEIEFFEGEDIEATETSEQSLTNYLFAGVGAVCFICIIVVAAVCIVKKRNKRIKVLTKSPESNYQVADFGQAAENQNVKAFKVVDVKALNLPKMKYTLESPSNKKLVDSGQSSGSGDDSSRQALARRQETGVSDDGKKPRSPK